MVKGKSKSDSSAHPLGEALISRIPEFVIKISMMNLSLDVHYSDSSIHLYAYDNEDKLILHRVFYVKGIKEAIKEFNEALIDIDSKYTLYELDLIDSKVEALIQKIREEVIIQNKDILPEYHGYSTEITESSVIVNAWVTLKDDKFVSTGKIEIELLIDDDLIWTGDIYITLFGVSRDNMASETIYSKAYMTNISIALDHFIWVIKDALHQNDEEDLDELKLRLTNTIFKALDEFNILPF